MNTKLLNLMIGIFLVGLIAIGSPPAPAQAVSSSDGLTLTQVAKITAGDGQSSDFFGNTAAIYGDTLVVGAYYADNLGVTDQGAAYVYYRNLGGIEAWGQMVKLVAADGATGDTFGVATAIEADTIAIGARYADVNGNGNQGAVYLFERNAGGADAWGQVKKITAIDGSAGDLFGQSVALDNETLVIGALGADVNGNTDQGIVYVYYRNLGGVDNWGQAAKLTASDGSAGDYFGWPARVDGDVLVASSSAKNNLQGAAYVFYRNQGGADVWGEVKKLIAVDGQSEDRFGYSLGVSGDIIACGAYLADPGGNIDQGAVYVYQRDAAGADQWGQVKKLIGSDSTYDDRLGISVAIDGDTILTGAYTASPGGVYRAGAAYAYLRDSGGSNAWEEVAKITASDPGGEDEFGYSIYLDEETAVVGAYAVDVNGVYNQGAAYVFSLHLSPPEPLVWQYKASMPHAVYNMGFATGANNNVYLFGGDEFSCTPLQFVQIYHPLIDSWTEGAPMPTGRWGSGAALAPDGNIYVIGGRGVGCGKQSLATVEMYRPSENTWETRSPMPTARNDPGVAAFGGKIYVFGGAIGVDANQPLATVEAYDPVMDTWSALANMPYSGYGLRAVTAPNGKIYLFGSNGRPGWVLEYDPTAGVYQEKASMPTPRDLFGAVLGSDGKIYVMGGNTGPEGISSAVVEAYDPQTNSWSAETNLLTASRNMGTAGVGNSIFSFGGIGPASVSGEDRLDLVQAALVTTPSDPPTPDFTWSPADPSIYDSIQFCDSSTDPAGIGFNNYWWDFGDGLTLETSAACVTHTYATDGDYTAWYKVQTSDGRSAEITKTVLVRTHDVFISRLVVPPSARVGQTKQISIGVRNLRYPETVTVELYKNTPSGYVLVSQQTKLVPVRADNRMTDFIFNYKFTSGDIGKVTFKAVAVIQGYRDAVPANNVAISLPTVVSR